MTILWNRNYGETMKNLIHTKFFLYLILAQGIIDTIV